MESSSQHYTIYQTMVHHNVTNKYQPHALYPALDDTDSSEYEYEEYEDDEYEDEDEDYTGFIQRVQKQSKNKIVKPKAKKKAVQPKPKPKPKGLVTPAKRKAVTAGPAKKKKAYPGAEKGQGGEIMFELSMMRYATVGEFKGKLMVGIREYYEEGGKLLPSKKGISLSVEQWNRLKGQMKQIDKVVKDLS